MGKSLFVTEKPSVAMEFVKLLNIKGNKGDGFIEGDRAVFTWCVGHMVTMSYPEVYDEKYKRWSLGNLPFLPDEYKYEIIPAVAKQFNTVKNLLNREDIDTIYVCTDSGREGEYIYRLVEQMSKVQGKKRLRVWIDSQTEDEIRRGIKEAKPLEEYDALSHSAYLRAKEDYLLGINFSRLLTLIYGKTLSNILNKEQVVIAVGRVMSCVLGMIVDREREIRSFVKNNFYKITASFNIDEALSYDGEWKAVEGSKFFDTPLLYNEGGFKKKEDAEKLIEEFREICSENKAVIEQVSKSNENKNAPLLFNLAELQNECSKRFKINPDETLGIVQSLYEKKMLTYPRTDARVLSTAVAKEIHNNIIKLTNFTVDSEIKPICENILNNKWHSKLSKSKYVDDSKITDHYAIIPTGEGLGNYTGLKSLEKQVYIAVLRRFLAIFYPPAKYSKVSVTTKIGTERFFTSDKVCTDNGYLDVLQPEKEASESKNMKFLSTLKKGQLVAASDFIIKEGETSPPKRYSSGSIIIAMENAGKLIEDEELREHIKGSGIGTSATRAEILKKLEKIDYISTNPKTQILTPTTKGEMIYEVVKNSIPTLLNPTLTASWEKGLKMVAQKEIEPSNFMTKLEDYTKNNVGRVLNHNNIISIEHLFAELIKTNNLEIDQSKVDNILGICPFCKDGQIVKNPKGYGCNNWQSGCKFFVGNICGKNVSPMQIRKLIKFGKTDIIHGLKSKKGSEFSARLGLKDGEIKLLFE